MRHLGHGYYYDVETGDVIHRDRVVSNQRSIEDARSWVMDRVADESLTFTHDEGVNITNGILQ